MEQYIPDTPAYVSWNPLLVILWSEWNSTYLTPLAGVSGMYCSILITVSQEGHSKLHMQGSQVCTVPFWSQYHKKKITTFIYRGVRYVLFHYMQDGILFLWYCDHNGTVHTWHSCICKLESSSCDTVIRVPFWSQYHKKRIPAYICSGVRYVLFHSDHSITKRGF
jgi:hypothetical protein